MDYGVARTELTERLSRSEVRYERKALRGPNGSVKGYSHPLELPLTIPSRQLELLTSLH